MTSDQLMDLLITRLVRERGGGRHRWRKIMGDVRLYSLTTHPHCNWAITPSGTSLEIEAVEHLADEVRLAHPIVERR